jgi:hypothetical protein
LNAPIYVSVPVQDEKIVDNFLQKLDSMLAIYSRRVELNRWIEIDNDFFKLDAPAQADQKAANVRGYGFRFGPIKWRFFWSRVGDRLIFSSKPEIIEELSALAAAPKAADAPAKSPIEAHGLLRIRPENWKQVLPDYRLGWAENNREACLNNLSRIGSVARAYASQKGAAADNNENFNRLIQRQADKIHAVHFFCPEGGQYIVTPDGKSVVCSAHGSVLEPRQPKMPSENTPANSVVKNFTGASAALTFLEDGLHAVLTIERK